MNQCACGSWAINQHLHGRVVGVDPHLCDVCYWRKRAAPPEAWIGCGECDVAFPCHNGQAKCLRLNNPDTKRKPLTKKQVNEIGNRLLVKEVQVDLVDIVRAVEQAHFIM